MAILYFPISHNALFAPKFCINYCCEIHLGGLHIPAKLGEQTECIKGNWKIENDCQCYFLRFSKK